MSDDTKTGTELVRFEVTDRAGNAVTAVAPAHLAERFPTLGNAEDMAELIAEVFGEQGGTLSITDLLRAKVPDGNTKAFTIGDDVTKTITGIILVRNERRNYWEKSIEEGGGNQAPDCYSRDAVNGIGRYGVGSEANPSGLCESCPMAQWIDGADGKRVPPPCKQQEAVLVLTEASAFPLLLTVPRTSIKPFRDYWKRTLLAGKMKSTLEVVTTIGLKQDKNDNGVDYNILTFAIGEDVTAGMDRTTKKQYKAGLLALAREFGEILKSVDTSRDTEEPERQNYRPPTGDPDAEGGVSMDEPLDDDPTAAYANAGAGAGQTEQ